MEAQGYISAGHIEISYEFDAIQVRPPGNFDFAALSQVLEQVENGTFGDQVRECVINMEIVEYIDSSLLGGLMILREKLGGDSSTIRLINCAREVKKIFEVVKFNTLFQVS